MNTDMYENPVTQDNLERCRHYGYKVVEPAVGYLACGDTGKGKMPEPYADPCGVCRQVMMEFCSPYDFS